LIDRDPVTTPNIYSDAARLIQQADVLLICAGAGMGVDSGLPDFRGNHGFWKAYPALEQEGLTFMDLANPQGFEKMLSEPGASTATGITFIIKQLHMKVFKYYRNGVR
jgi:NAD-dependent SIR2 family protein deacetylase